MNKDIKALRRDYEKLGTYEAVAQKHGCSRQYIGRLLKGKVSRSRTPATCDLCGGEAQKNGKRPDGRQNYFCPSCKKHFLKNKQKRGRKPINGTDRLTPTEKYHRWKKRDHAREDSALE